MTRSVDRRMVRRVARKSPPLRRSLVSVIVSGVLAFALIAAAQPVSTVDVTTVAASLYGVSVASHSQAWAVGDVTVAGGELKGQILRWNGSHWSKIATPNPTGATSSLLFGVDARSTSDAWAVGDDSGGTAGVTRILHWNGARWAQTASPTPANSELDLNSISADALNDAWAAGWYQASAASSTLTALVLHWNGSRWTQISVPNPTRPNAAQFLISGLAAISPNNVWAVGTSLVGVGGNCCGLILHWNGVRWSQVPAPNFAGGSLSGVSAASASDIWAVGDQFDQKLAVYKTLTLHWDGAKWSRIPSPNPAGSHLLGSALSSVSSFPGHGTWAVGSYDPTSSVAGTGQTELLLRWTGTRWTQVPVPNLNAPANTVGLVGVSAFSATDAWAVSSYDVGPTNAKQALILHWNGNRWSRS